MCEQDLNAMSKDELINRCKELEKENQDLQLCYNYNKEKYENLNKKLSAITTILTL